MASMVRVALLQVLQQKGINIWTANGSREYLDRYAEFGSLC